MEGHYTEQQAINITIEHGYDGSELNTSVWKQRGCLQKDRTFKALISKLETIYNHVEVIGTGKKRKYILTDKKDQQTERTFNYKGTVLTPQDEIMQEYIFNTLLKYDNYKQSYKGWAKLIGFIDTEPFAPEEMIKEIKNIHTGFPTIYNPKEAVSIFIQTLNIRNKDIIEKTFQRLHKANRIHVTEIYNYKYIDDKYEQVTQSDYELTLQYIKEFLEEKGISYYAYSQTLTSVHKSKKMKKVIRQVEEYLSNNFEIDYIFKTFHINILDRTIKQQVTKEQFDNAYYDRLIKLSIDRQSKNTYIDSVSFWRRFYLLNTLSLLKYIGINTGDLLEQEMKTYSEKKQDYDTDLTIHRFEQMEKKRYTFVNN